MMLSTSPSFEKGMITSECSTYSFLCYLRILQGALSLSEEATENKSASGGGWLLEVRSEAEDAFSTMKLGKECVGSRPCLIRTDTFGGRGGEHFGKSLGSCLSRF